MSIDNSMLHKVRAAILEGSVLFPVKSEVEDDSLVIKVPAASSGGPSPMPEAPRFPVTIIELHQLERKGFAWLSRWRRANPGRILLLTATAELITGTFALKLLQAGISGVLPIDASSQLLRKAIFALGNGELWMPRAATEAALALVLATSSAAGENAYSQPGESVPSLPRLTPRETEILMLLRNGLSNKDIARQLCISPETVKKCLAGIYSKMGISGRTKLIAQLNDRARVESS
jgi:DNA-binding NarL/FixJ family response regulator